MELQKRLDLLGLNPMGRLYISIPTLGTNWQIYSFLNHQLVLGFHIQILICTLQVTSEQLKMHISFLLSGLEGFLNTSIETSILLEKVMQVIMFHSCLESSTRRTKELRIQSSISRVSWYCGQKLH